MRAPPVHRLALDSHDIFTYKAGSYFALFDLGTYTRFVAREADPLDLRAHLQRQTQALTILAWDVARPLSRLDFVLIPEQEPIERIVPGGRQPFARGWVRSFGRLAFAGNELIEACAHDAEFDLLHTAALGRPRLFDVPAGTYDVQIFAGTGEPGSDMVVLRHYPFPPPRVAPVRLGGHHLIEETKEDQATSHKAP